MKKTNSLFLVCVVTLLSLCVFQSCEPERKAKEIRNIPTKLYVIGVDSIPSTKGRFYDYGAWYYTYYVNQFPNAKDTVLIVRRTKPSKGGAVYHFGDTLTLK